MGQDDAPSRRRPALPAFERWRLHHAANLVHVAANLDIPEGGWRLDKVSWVGGCVLFDRERLVSVGGFSF